jgi:hypothetical protein
MKRKIKFKNKSLLRFALTALMALGFLGDDKNGTRPPQPIYKLNTIQTSGKQGDAYAMYINNIYLPMNRKGIIADVNIPPPDGKGSWGQFAGGTFLFSSGFFLSGLKNGEMWANAVASATLVEDYLQGTIATGSSDPNAVMYVLNSGDEAFGQSWKDWEDAVNLGADFYDGNGDGVYNPNETNGIPGWQEDEDRPDLLGDETAWCVYYDAVPQAQRRWNTISAKGIEIRQTVFAYASAGALGNIIFVRYRFKYVGLSPDDPAQMTDVYFGVWADPDVGDAVDDVVGVDVARNAGYTYNKTPDAVYGSQVPCFMIDFFSGPRAYIPGETYIEMGGTGNDPLKYDEGLDTPLDTAYSYRGQIKGVVEFPGAKNLPISSFVEYINGDPVINDPSNATEARNYMLGLDINGEIPDPCTFAYGNGPFPGCETTDPRFWFSGDPVTGTGWLNVMTVDQRQMTNSGPFVLDKNVENEIILAYVVGRGANPLDGITVTREIDDGAQQVFDFNYQAPSPPPAPRVTLSSSDDFIDISWDTREQIISRSDTAITAWDMLYEGYRVWAFKTNNNVDIVNGQENSKLIATYDKRNFIADIYKENSQTGGRELLYPESEQLDSAIYADPLTGRIRIRIFDDPFDATKKVTKGTPYYFAVTSYGINYDALIHMNPDSAFGDFGDYYLSAAAFAQEAENIRNVVSIIAGEDLYNPPVPVQPANQVAGGSTGNIGFDVINNDDLTGNTYEVTFSRDPNSAAYKMLWNLANINTSTPLLTNRSEYTYGLTTIDQPITEGFITRVEDQTATIGDAVYEPESAIWYSSFDSASATGVWYVGLDIPQGQKVPSFESSSFLQQSNYITADRLRNVELRFGAPNSGKAYRYINAYRGIPATNNYTYAAAIVASDTVGKGVVGNWDIVNDRANGFVDVPFQAWVVDERFDEEYQLAVGFVERRRTSTYPTANPDGVWDPSSNLRGSGEVIIIFDRPYDQNGGHLELTGGEFSTPGGPVTVWSNLLKPATAPGIPDDAIGITQEQKDIFKSSWFNAMYVIGLQRLNSTAFFTTGDVFTAQLEVYPYTEADVYQFSTLDGSTINADQEKELWERVNVYPNPLFGYNPLTSFETNTPDEPWITFTNLPEQVTIKIYSLSGQLLRTLDTGDKSTPSSPFIRWNIQNESGLRVASGMYLAIVSSPVYGDKVLKFAILMPQKQIQRF